MKNLCSCFWKKMCSYLWIYFFYVKDPRKFKTESVTAMRVRWSVPKQSFLISFFSLLWCPASNELHCPSKMFFIIIESLWKIFSIFCAETVKNLRSCSWTYFFGDCFRKKNVQLIFFMLRQMCGCFWKHFNFFKERAVASKKILRKNDCF